MHRATIIQDRGFRSIAVIGLLAMLLPVGRSLAAEFDETFEFEGRSLLISNLIGEVSVEGWSGRGYQVEVAVRGRDASRERVRIESDRGTRSRLAVVFPKDERRYVYPALGRGQRSITVRRSDSSDSWLRELLSAFSGRRIRVSGRGNGVEIWADVVVRVPDGGELRLEHGVGDVEAREVEADLELDVSAGKVAGEGLRGSILVDTGSGSVELTAVDGPIRIDTGSGPVRLQSADAPEVSIDTGSGTVTLSGVRTEVLVVDTGSGGVNAEGVSADEAQIDTGSGTVVLAMDAMGDGRFDIDTGSGSITLLVPAAASAEVEADTGSGGIAVDLPGIRTLYRERDEMKFLVGDGRASVRLDTGSGRIRVASSEGTD